MAGQDSLRIAAGQGKLSVLMPDIGAVTTTFIAGLGAVRHGMAFGSLTQMATIPLGKRTDYLRWPITAPGLSPEQDILIQLMKPNNTLRWMRGEDLITHLGLEYYD